MLYESTQGVLKEFDTRLIRCKKYNEAKIHRKYEIAISSLTDELKAAK